MTTDEVAIILDRDKSNIYYHIRSKGIKGIHYEQPEPQKPYDITPEGIKMLRQSLKSEHKRQEEMGVQKSVHKLMAEIEKMKPPSNPYLEKIESLPNKQVPEHLKKRYMQSMKLENPLFNNLLWG